MEDASAMSVDVLSLKQTDAKRYPSAFCWAVLDFAARLAIGAWTGSGIFDVAQNPPS